VEQIWRDVHVGESFMGHTVAIGNHGTQVFCDSGALSQHTRLYACEQGLDPYVIWEQSSSEDAFHHKVVAAERIAAYVSCREHVVGSQRQVHIDFYDDATSAPRWSYVFPELFSGGDPGYCQITPDGNWVVAGLNGITDVHLVVLDTSGVGTPHRDFHLPVTGAVDAFEISDDCSRIYVANMVRGYIFDLDTGAQIFKKTLYGNQVWGHAFSGDGLTFVYLRDGAYRVMRDLGSGYTQIAAFQPFNVGSDDLPYLVDLSYDGNTLACTGFDGSDLLTSHVFAYDVPSEAQLLFDSWTGAGSYDSLPSDVEITPDGQRIVVGQWGDQAGLVPEIVAYERQDTGGSFSFFDSFNLPGSVHDMDLSASGKKLATTGRDVHANVPSGDKVIQMFDLGSDLRVSRFQHGVTVDFTFYPPSGTSAAFLVEANGLYDQPRTFGIGTLHITRPTQRHPMVMNGQIAVLNDFPVGSGATRYFQAYAIHGPYNSDLSLSEDWVQVKP